MQSSLAEKFTAPITVESHSLGVDEFGPSTTGADIALISESSLNFDGADNARNPVESLGSKKNGLLPDLKASNAGEQARGTHQCDGEPSPSCWQENDANIELTAKLLIHMSTGGSLAPFNENFGVTSSDWCRVSSRGSTMDVATDAVENGAVRYDNATDGPQPNRPLLPGYGDKTQPDPPKLHSNSTYMGNISTNTAATFDRRLSWHDIRNGYQANEYKFLAIRFFNGETAMFNLDDPEQFHHVETIVTGSIEENVAGWIASKEKMNFDILTPKIYHTESIVSKKRPRRTIDESCAIEPTENDVLFGRGGHTNLHPGNIRFREKARELRSWYEGCYSKEDKYHVSNVMVQSFKSKGHRFLEKGSDGLWHEVIGNGARKKASQALRERIGAKVKKGETNLQPTGGGATPACPTAWPGSWSDKR
jgi:hypothetical protein